MTEFNTGRKINDNDVWSRTFTYSDGRTLTYEYVKITVAYEITVDDLSDSDVIGGLIDKGSLDDTDEEYEGNEEQVLDAIESEAYSGLDHHMEWVLKG